MPFDMLIIMKRIYPFIFALAFWGISIAPVLKSDVSINTFEKDFWGHERLIEGFNTLRFTLGDRVFPSVIVGKDGWLFYTADRSIDDYQHTNAYTNSELADYQKRFDALNGQLQQNGIMLVVVIAPNKSTIYPEYMPDQILQIKSKSRVDQFVEYMHRYGKTTVIDFRSDLIKESKTEQLFYKTGTHWNPSGEYIAYTKIISILSQKYPVLVSHPLADYEAVHAGLMTHDIARIQGMPNVKEDYWALQPKFETGTTFREIPLSDGNIVRISRNQNQELPSALIYHDSFLNGVISFLEPHFRQTTSIFRTSVPGIWNINWVDQVHPDIVIIEYVERYLNYDFYIPASQ
jgi:alginate O-acetyltransferase complex protein AlgJ